MRLDADEIVRVLEKEIQQYGQAVESREVGEVLEIGDGIARVYGLAGVMAGEMVEFTRAKVRGLAFNLEENSVGVIILGEYLEIVEGDEVRSTGALLQVPVGPAMVGRVVDPLGRPLDGKGEIVYVACGQKESTVAQAVENLRKHGAMDYTIVVIATASDPAPLTYIAPYAGCAMAEYFMYERGQDTLCVYDDLSKQAAAYRQLSLLMRRPPGREAYPGDIFYSHSRLLERSARVADRYVIVPATVKDNDKIAEDWGVNDLDNPRQARKPNGK